MSIANYLTALDAQRDQLARNLVTMGVQASESEKLNTLVPKVLQIPSGRPEVTLFRNGNDALTTYGESIYTFYIDGYRSIAGFADVYSHFCCAENAYALYYNQPDFNWGAVIYTMCITPERITPASRILFTYKSGTTDAGEMWLVRKSSQQRDDRFEENYAGAKAAGIPVGAYWYSYAMTSEKAELEADVFLSVIKGKQFEFPVYFDLEEKKQFDLGKDKVSAIMRAFLEKVEKAGYFVGLYGSASSLVTHTADDIKSRYTIWLAHWCDQTNYSGAHGIWQHSEKGKVAGIREASIYFSIGEKKLRRLAEEHTGDFAVINGNRYLIIRTKFEQFLLETSII